VGRRRRQVTPEERALWHHVVRDAQPLRPSTSPDAAELPSAKPPAKTPATPAAVSAKPPSPVIAPPPRLPASRRLVASGPVDLDRRAWLKLRRGLHPIDARLDLHGLTQAEAHARLAGFLASAQQRGNRCVLVITGRGLRHGGTLRAMTPRWLDEAPNRARVLAYAEAQLRHGGEGALYVLVRRRALGGGP
jgi:DNA-nicking Smr family endonuclease